MKVREWGRTRLLPLGIAVLVTLSLLGGAGIGAGAETAPEADYEVGSVDAFDYYNSRGFEDTNGDGRVVVAVTSTIDLSESRDPTLRYGGDVPFVLRGDGGFTNVRAPLAEFAATDIADDPETKSDAAVTIEGLTITNARGDDDGWRDDVLELGGSVTLRDVTVRNTTSVLQTKGDVRVVDSEFVDTGQVVLTERRVTVTGTRIRNATTDADGVVHSDGRVTLTDTAVRGVEGSRGGAVNAGTVLARNVTISGSEAHLSGGAFNAEGGVRIVDSTIEQVTAGRNGGAVRTDGTVRLLNSTLANASADQDSSLFGFDRLEIVDSRLEHVGPMGPNMGGYGDATVLVEDSVLVDTGRFQTEELRLVGSTVRSTRGPFAKARTVRVRRSRIHDSGGIKGSDTLVTDSTLRNVGQLRADAPTTSVTVRDSTLVSFGRFTSFNEYWTLRLSNVTIHGPDSPLVPEVRQQSIRHVNIIEAETPVFAGRLPNRSMVFVDTTNDTEAPGEWTADVFWSRDRPFASVERLPANAVRMPTPTPTPTPDSPPTATGTQSRSERETGGSARDATTATATTGDEQRWASGSGPGFGVGGALLAMVAALVVGGYVRRD